MEFTCAICQVICSGASELTIHAASHISTIRKPFQCSVSGCGTEFKHLHHLRRHMKFIHSADNNARAYDCSECTRTYSDSRKLETHLANHHNIIKCCRLGCSSTFSTKSQLKLHKQNHPRGVAIAQEVVVIKEEDAEHRYNGLFAPQNKAPPLQAAEASIHNPIYPSSSPTDLPSIAFTSTTTRELIVTTSNWTGSLLSLHPSNSIQDNFHTPETNTTMKPLSAKKFAQMALFEDDDDDENGPRAIPPTYRPPLPRPRVVRKPKKSRPEDFSDDDSSADDEPESNWGSQPDAPPLSEADIMRTFPEPDVSGRNDVPDESYHIPLEFLTGDERFVNGRAASAEVQPAEDEGMSSSRDLLHQRKMGSNRYAFTTNSRKRKYTWKDGSVPTRRLGHVNYPEGHKYAKFNKRSQKAKVKAQGRPNSKSAEASEDEDTDDDGWMIEGGVDWDSSDDNDEEDDHELHGVPI